MLFCYSSPHRLGYCLHVKYCTGIRKTWQSLGRIFVSLMFIKVKMHKRDQLSGLPYNQFIAFDIVPRTAACLQRKTIVFIEMWLQCFKTTQIISIIIFIKKEISMELKKGLQSFLLLKSIHKHYSVSTSADSRKTSFVFKYHWDDLKAQNSTVILVCPKLRSYNKNL